MSFEFEEKSVIDLEFIEFLDNLHSKLDFIEEKAQELRKRV